MLVFSLMLIALACPPGGNVYADGDLPDVMVRAGVTRLAEAARLYDSQDAGAEQGLTDAVRSFLAEFTDVQYAARLIFSSHWETATLEQRERFVEAFNSQVTRLLVQFIPEVDFDSVSIDPFSGNTEDSPHIVRVTFRTSDGETVHFALVIHEKETRWLIFDVLAEGVSYVKTYRSQFAGEAADIGLEATIERFEIRSARP